MRMVPASAPSSSTAAWTAAASTLVGVSRGDEHRRSFSRARSSSARIGLLLGALADSDAMLAISETKRRTSASPMGH